MGTGSHGSSEAAGFEPGLAFPIAVSHLMGEGGPCLSPGKSRYSYFALNRGFRKLHVFGAALNDLTGALRIFLQDPGQAPSFL